MAKITTNLKELRNAEVAYISLVDRAATRIPFRILKRDDKESAMSINLAGLGRATKKSEAKPAVSAVVVMDNPNAAYMEQVVNTLKAEGFKVDKATKNDDGTVTYAQDDTPLADTQFVKVSDQLLVAMKGFDTQSETLRDNCDFNEHVAASGFFTGLSTAFDGLYATIGDALKSDQAQEVVPTALGKFSAYVTSLVSGLPSSAFKADQVLQSIARKSSEGKNTDLESLPTEAPDGITQNDWDDLSEDDKLAWVQDSTNQSPSGTTQKEDAMTNAKKTDSNTILELSTFLKQAPSGSDGTAWATMSDGDKLAWYASSYNKANASGAQDGDNIPGAAPNIDVQSPTAKADAEAAVARIEKTESDLAALAGAMSKLAESVTSVVAKMDEQSTNFTTQINAIAQKSDATLSKVAGVVIAPASAGDTPAGRVQSVAKADSTDPRSGSFDTAFIRKAERNRR